MTVGWVRRSLALLPSLVRACVRTRAGVLALARTFSSAFWCKTVGETPAPQSCFPCEAKLFSHTILGGCLLSHVSVEMLDDLLIREFIDGMHVPGHQVHIRFQHRVQVTRIFRLDNHEACTTTGQVVPPLNLFRL